MDSFNREWAGRRGGVDGEGGWRADTLKKKTAMVCSWKYSKEHSAFAKTRHSLAAVSHQVYLYKCTPVVPHTPKWTVTNLQGHKHDASNSRPCYM